MKFGIPLDMVEQRSIVEYRLMLFTVINMAILESGMGEFKLMTEDEEMEEFEQQIAYYMAKGVFN